jgi:two-component system, OmpR family, KDP operon response regulator KdpE
MATILLVDDDPSIQRATAMLLRSRGYSVVVAGTGADALDAFDRDRPNLVVVDLGLPDMDGARVCRDLRARADVPILVLSVRGEERTKVQALDAGADDYVTKPFGPEELLARIRAGLRRASADDVHGRVQRGDLVIDFDKRRVQRSDEEVRLTPKEFELLTLLVAHAGRVITHRVIAKRIWGVSTAAQQEHLRVLVGQLRKKLEPDPSQPRYVLTEPWVGYRFADESP